MADSILRLKVESQEYDNKLKQAAQGLTRYADQCRKVGGTLEVVEKETLDYVRAIGQMDTTSRTATGKLAEMKKTFVELSAQYKQMTDAEKASPFGKALAASLDELKPRVMETKRQLDDINKSISDVSSSSGGGFLSGLGDKMGGALQVFAGNMLTKAAGAVMNLGSEISNMIQQGVELARVAEGIEQAYSRLNQPNLLKNLKEATHGTVTELELMKAAVKFNDFNLPLEELGTMLAFAQQKAKDTGQSVDFLVESIVNGLGRKSLMILDNLGLSATEIRDKMKDTGDMTKAVGEIIREKMAKAGDYVETAADRAAKADADLQDAMRRLGETFAPLQEAGVSLFKSWEIGALNFIKNALDPLIARFTEAGRLQASYNRQGGSEKVNRMTNILQNTSADKRQGLYNTQVNSFNRFINERQEYINLLNSYRAGSRGEGNGYTAENKARIDQLYKRFGTDDTSRLQSQIDGATKQLQEYQKAAKDILKPVEANIDTKQAEQNVKTLTAHLKSLEKQRKDAVKKGDQELVESLTKQISQTKTNLGYLDPNALKTSPTTTPRTTTKVELTEEEKKQKDAERELETATKRLAEARQELATAKTGGDLKNIYAAEKRVTTAESNVQLKQNALQQLKDQTIKVNVEEGKVNLPQVPTDDQTIKVNVEAGKVNLPQLPDEVTIPLTIANLDAFKSKIKEDLSNADLGSSVAQSLQENMSDASAISAIMQTAIKNGIDTAQFDTDGLMQKLLSGQDISDTDIQAYVDQLNEKLKEKFDKTEWPKVLIKFDADTKTIKSVADDQSKKTKELAKQWGTVSTAISSVGSAMQQIEDPAAKVMGIVAQAIATIALTYAKSLEKTFGPWDWIAAAAAGAATMISTITAIKSATAGSYAEGGIIPGNSFTGDRLTANVNSGELILNRAQQDTIANQLTTPDSQAGGGGVNSRPYVSGEQIFLGLNNYLRASGRGEIITSKG